MADLVVYEKPTCRKLLVQRPIVAGGDRAVPARPVERVLELL
jgi:hypothetical protein